MTDTDFKQGYSSLQPELYRFAWSLTRNETEAEDLLQETMYRAYCHCQDFKSGTNFKAWLLTIMRNVHVSRYRKKRRSPLIQDMGYVDSLHAKNASVDNQGVLNINLQEIESKLAELDELYATPFTMFYTGYRYDEIARHLRIPIGTVKSRIYSARQQLRNLIGSSAMDG